MAGVNARLIRSRRIKEAMKRPEVQAKLHAPRKKRRADTFKERLIEALSDPAVLERLHTLFPAFGQPPGPGPTPQGPGLWWHFTGRQNDPVLRWVEGSGEFTSKLAAEEAAHASGSERPLYIVGPFQNRPASVENLSRWEVVPAKKIPTTAKKFFTRRKL